MKNLGKKLITLILTVAMFFGTGTTNVFAYALHEQSAEPTAERNETNNYDIVGWASHVYYELEEIDRRIATITTKLVSGSPYINEINEKKSEYNINGVLYTDPNNTSDALLNLSQGNKIRFIDNINDPGLLVISAEDISYTQQQIYGFYEEGSNILKTFHDTKIKEMDKYLKSIENKIDIMEKLKESFEKIKDDTDGNVLASINSIEDIINPESYNFVLSHIDLTKIIYDETTGNINLDDALDSTIEWTINTPVTHQDYLNDFKNLISRFLDIQKNVNIFEENKTLYDLNTYPEINGFDFESINTGYTNLINKLSENIETMPKMSTFKEKLKIKLTEEINNRIKPKYNNVNLEYKNDVDREISYNALTEILGTNGLENLKYLFKITRINDSDIKEFIDKFDSEYEKSKLSVDNTLASLKINGIKLDVSKEKQTLYLPYEVTILDIETILSNANSTISIVKPNLLVVGENIVKIIVTAQNGNTKEYVVVVIRKEEEKKTEIVTLMNNQVDSTSNLNNTITSSNTNIDNVEIEKEKDKYEDNELVENKVSGLTVFFIVAGIALISFGVYLLFGDKTKPLIIKKDDIKQRPVDSKKVINKKATPKKPINKKK